MTDALQQTTATLTLHPARPLPPHALRPLVYEFPVNELTRLDTAFGAVVQRCSTENVDALDRAVAALARATGYSAIETVPVIAPPDLITFTLVATAPGAAGVGPITTVVTGVAPDHVSPDTLTLSPTRCVVYGTIDGAPAMLWDQMMAPAALDPVRHGVAVMTPAALAADPPQTLGARERVRHRSLLAHPRQNLKHVVTGALDAADAAMTGMPSKTSTFAQSLAAALDTPAVAPTPIAQACWVEGVLSLAHLRETATLTVTTAALEGPDSWRDPFVHSSSNVYGHYLATAMTALLGEFNLRELRVTVTKPNAIPAFEGWLWVGSDPLLPGRWRAAAALSDELEWLFDRLYERGPFTLDVTLRMDGLSEVALAFEDNPTSDPRPLVIPTILGGMLSPLLGPERVAAHNALQLETLFTTLITR